MGEVVLFTRQFYYFFVLPALTGSIIFLFIVHMHNLMELLKDLPLFLMALSELVIFYPKNFEKIMSWGRTNPERLCMSVAIMLLPAVIFVLTVGILYHLGLI